MVQGGEGGDGAAAERAVLGVFEERLGLGILGAREGSGGAAEFGFALQIRAVGAAEAGSHAPSHEKMLGQCRA